MPDTHPMPPTLFFAGTDTDVGKTYVACCVAAAFRRSGKRVGVYKPVASGCRDENGERVSDDATAIWKAAGSIGPLRDVCPQKFLAPLAPPSAAAAENSSVDASLLRSAADVWRGSCDVLIVEGAGGLFSPLADGMLNIDLVKRFADSRLIIVAANRLGVIHQTLATVEAAQHRGCTAAGIILSNPSAEADTSCQTNASQISRYTDVPILAQLSHRHFESEDTESEGLGFFFSTNFIEALFMQ